jgi:predicted aspartyl protease
MQFAGHNGSHREEIMTRRSLLPLAAAAAWAVACPNDAHAADWRVYSMSGHETREIDASTVQSRDGLVFFTYREQFPYDTPEVFRRPLSGVVDCKARRSSDVAQGQYTLRDVFEGTQQAEQLELACRLAASGAPQANAAPAEDAQAGTGAAAAPTTGCRYMRLGGLPAEWRGSRLRVRGSIDGTPTNMIIDTGATNVTISGRMAKKLSLPFVDNAKAESFGTGGVSKVALAKVSDFEVGGVKGKNLYLPVTADMGGFDVLIGTNFLFTRDLEIDGRDVAFFEPVECGNAPLAYWARNVPFVPTEEPSGDDLRAIVIIRVNGVKLRALVDTGAPMTLISLDAARQLGIDPAAKGQSGYDSGGVGTHKMKVWPVVFDEFALGDEVISHPHIAVADLWSNVREDMSFMRSWWVLRRAPDAVLGADFLKAHHILFANSQRRMYFSYEGGALFNVPTQTNSAALSTAGMAASDAAR